MKVNQPGPDELLVTDFPVFLGGFCGIVFFFSSIGLLATSVTRPVSVSGILEFCLAMFLSGFGIVAFLKRTLIRFDRRSGQVNWTRRGVFGKKMGQIAFSDIQDVAVEFIIGGYRGPSRKTYRVALLTTAGSWPLTEYYSTTQSTCEKTREALLKFLGISNSRSAAPIQHPL